MAKLVKSIYYGKNGEKKLNCYHLSIPKSVVQQSGIDESELLKFVPGDKQIIISTNGK